MSDPWTVVLGGLGRIRDLLDGHLGSAAEELREDRLEALVDEDEIGAAGVCRIVTVSTTIGP